MKKLLFTSLAIATLVFTGCSQKNPEMDMTKDNASKTTNMADKKASDISGMDKNNMDTNNMGSHAMKKKNVDVAGVIAMLERNVNKVYFDFDKYNIRADMQPKIQENSSILNKTNAVSFSIKVEGNSDEWGTDEYNYALGLKRAKSVKDALVASGTDSNRIMLVSYGESNPACKESIKACWDENRRVELKLLP